MKVRVYELAKEVGVEVKTVMADLQSMGEFVRSASSTLEQDVVIRLCDRYRRESNGTGASALPQQEPHGLEAEARAIQSQQREGMRREVSQVFDIDLSRVRLKGDSRSRLPQAARSPSPVGSPTPRRPGPPGRGHTAEAKFNETCAQWALVGLDYDDVRAWLAAGFDSRQERLALQCVSAGLTPRDMNVIVDGLSLGSRIVGGEALDNVLARMRELGLRRAS